MNVFLSWSGPKSGAVAQVLQKYLPGLINQVRPWLSSKEIAAGARWSAEIAANLEASNVGIICVTAENRTEPWILFEAGAIAKLTSVGRAMVLRIDIKASDVTGPLSQFQSVGTSRDDMWKLVRDINAAGSGLVAEATLKITFDALWPTIESEIMGIISEPSSVEPPQRSTEEMLQELIALGRSHDTSFQGLAFSLDALRAQIQIQNEASSRTLYIRGSEVKGTSSAQPVFLHLDSTREQRARAYSLNEELERMSKDLD